MTFAQGKQLVLTAWVATVAIIGLVLAIDKPYLWLLVASVAVVPSAIASWLWNEPEATRSRRLAAARSRS